MQAARTRDTLSLTFSFFESRIIQHILRQIMVNYQTKPEQLDAKAAAVWYSTRGCETAKMSAEDTQEWVENLHHYKSANVQHLIKWSRRLATLNKTGQCRLNVKLDHAPILLTALNDHRLLIAATHDIGQEEMDSLTISSLKPAQQTAISEIDFLGAIIQEILRFLPGNPGGWAEAL
jgi:hypothetical protein